MSTVWQALGTGDAYRHDLGVRITHRPDHVSDTTLDIEVWDHSGGQDEEASISIDRDEAKGLYQALGDWLVSTHADDGQIAPDASRHLLP